LSFKEEVTFSFEATSDRALDDYYVAEPIPGVRILKMAMVYGANSSGKSNLLKAFSFLWEFFNRIPTEKERSTRFIPFMFDKTKNDPGSFELIFIVEKVKYKYCLEISEDTVLEEILYYYPGKQPAVVFDRRFDTEKEMSIVKFGPKIKITNQAIEAIQLKTLKNMSVLAAYSQVNLAISELNIPYNWLKNKFLYTIDPYTSLTKYSDNKIKSSVEIKKHVLEFVQAADLNITDISFEEEITMIPEKYLAMFEFGPFPEEEKKKIQRERAIHREKKVFGHKIIQDGSENIFTLPEELESQGTLRYYGLSAPFYETINNDSFLPIDEIGTALHPLLVMHFIKEFLRKSREAQLLFTTHNLSLLNEKDIIRKDAVWFTDKGIDGVTTVFSLADFNFRKELSYYNAYKHGKFGAIPNLED